MPEPDGSRHGTQSGPFLHLYTEIYLEIKKVDSIPFSLKKVSQYQYGHLISRTPGLQCSTIFATRIRLLQRLVLERRDRLFRQVCSVFTCS